MEIKAENKFVLQIHWWGKASHHDLRFLKGKVAIGLTLFQVKPISAINSGKKFLCDWKDYHDPKWMDFEGDIPPGGDIEGNPSKEYTAHMKILDQGKYEILDRKEDFTRFKIEGKILNGEYVVRQVEIKGEKKWLFWKAKSEEEKKLIEPDELDAIILEAKAGDGKSPSQEPWVLTLEDLEKLPDSAFALKTKDGRRLFPHHNFDGDTRIDVLKSQIARLNGERGFFDDIAKEERQAAYDVLAEHLKDAGEKDVPQLVEVKENKSILQRAAGKIKQIFASKQESGKDGGATEFDRVQNEEEIKRLLWGIMDVLYQTLNNIIRSDAESEEKASMSLDAFKDAGDAWAEVVRVMAKKQIKTARLPFIGQAGLDLEFKVGAKISKARLEKLKAALEILAEIMKEAEAEIQSQDKDKKSLKGVLEWEKL